MPLLEPEDHPVFDTQIVVLGTGQSPVVTITQALTLESSVLGGITWMEGLTSADTGNIVSVADPTKDLIWPVVLRRLFTFRYGKGFGPEDTIQSKTSFTETNMNDLNLIRVTPIEVIEPDEGSVKIPEFGGSTIVPVDYTTLLRYFGRWIEGLVPGDRITLQVGYADGGYPRYHKGDGSRFTDMRFHFVDRVFTYEVELPGVEFVPGSGSWIPSGLGELKDIPSLRTRAGFNNYPLSETPYDSFRIPVRLVDKPPNSDGTTTLAPYSWTLEEVNKIRLDAGLSTYKTRGVVPAELWDLPKDAIIPDPLGLEWFRFPAFRWGFPNHTGGGDDSPKKVWAELGETVSDIDTETDSGDADTPTVARIVRREREYRIRYVDGLVRVGGRVTDRDGSWQIVSVSTEGRNQFSRIGLEQTRVITPTLEDL